MAEDRPILIDAHAHMDLYEDDLRSAFEEIARHGIFTISNSMDLTSFRRNLELGEECDLVLPIFGVHPWKAPEYVDHLENLHDAIGRSPILGEIGLDYHFVEDPSEYPAQRKVFEFFLEVARGQDKIVNVHTKGAERDVLDLLTRYEISRAIVHWYSGSLDLLREYIDRGVYLTVGIGVIESEHIQQIAKEIPQGQLLTETDNPGGLKWLKGTPGMPSILLDVIRALAKIRKTSEDGIVHTVRANLARLFKDDPWVRGLPL